MKFGLHLVSIWFGVIIIFLVLAGAIAFTFTDFMDDKLFGTKRVVFIFILLSYGVYRGFRFYQFLKDSDDEK